MFINLYIYICIYKYTHTYVLYVYMSAAGPAEVVGAAEM